MIIEKIEYVDGQIGGRQGHDQRRKRQLRYRHDCGRVPVQRRDSHGRQSAVAEVSFR